MRAFAAIVVLSSALLLACSGGQGAGAPTGPSVAAAPVTLVTIGGDETAAVDLPRDLAIRESWPQRVFRSSLPQRAVFVNVAFRAATAADALAVQVPDALALHPTIVVVWLGSTDVALGTPIDEYGTELASVLGQARDAGARVLVVVAGGYGETARTEAQAIGADVVDVSDIPVPLGAGGHERVAAAVAKVLGTVT